MSSVDRVCNEDVMTTPLDTLFARAEMSMLSKGSEASCQVAMQPTRFTTGVEARRALCKFARPFANPGPRCKSVAAGLRRSLPYPSAAPVHTVS